MSYLLNVLPLLGYRDKADGAEDKFIEQATLTTDSASDPATDIRGDRMYGSGAQHVGKEVVISCHNVGLILPSKKPRTPNKTLLYNVNGCVQPRQLCAVMGPSGAGKTALLDIIFGNHMGLAAQQGDVLFNNVERTPQTQRRLAFVSASDIHIPVFTVRETLRYAAVLRMPFSTSKEQQHAQVEEVIERLGLKNSANTLVGNHLIRGISGGQKRLIVFTMMLSDIT